MFEQYKHETRDGVGTQLVKKGSFLDPFWTTRCMLGTMFTYAYNMHKTCLKHVNAMYKSSPSTPEVWVSGHPCETC